MHYKYICSSLGQISTCISQEDFPNNEIRIDVAIQKGRDVNYPKWEVVLGASDRVNIPCLMHEVMYT